MTPTREQVIEWAKEAGLLNRAAFNHETELYRLCNLAFDAGRDQGLREAKEVCEADGFVEQFRGLNEAARRIEQLRGK